jgi:hypothetical protein
MSGKKYKEVLWCLTSKSSPPDAPATLNLKCIKVHLLFHCSPRANYYRCDAQPCTRNIHSRYSLKIS